VKGFAEPFEIAAGDRDIVAHPPALQRFGIIEAEADAVFPRKPALRSQRFELRLVEQHSAGEDIGLDEVRAAGIAIEDAVIDADELQSRLATAPQIPGDAVE